MCIRDSCTRKHPSILHTRPRQASTTDVGVGTDDDIGAQVRCSMANTDENVASRSFERCRTGMAVTPVKVRVKGSDKSIVTYAFLDNGSNSSFCTDSLMKQLGVKGQRISLFTLERKNSTVFSNLVSDPLVSDLDENEYVRLPILYTRAEIPVSSDDVPTQSDIDQWPHLQGVFIPRVHAEVGLLIATDVPEALEPLEIKHSQEGGQERALVGPSMVLWGANDVDSTPLVSSLELTQNCPRWWKIFIIVTSLNQ